MQPSSHKLCECPDQPKRPPGEFLAIFCRKCDGLIPIADSPPTSPGVVPFVLGERLLIRRDKAEEVTKQGIVIPNAKLEKPPTGRIVAVGLAFEKHKQAMWDKARREQAQVLFDNHCGTPVSLNGEELLVVEEVDILLVIPNTSSPKESTTNAGKPD